MPEAKRRATGAKLFASLMEQDAKLMAKGFPPMTEWWRRTLEAFYLTGKRRMVARVGRKGTKSATGCRIAVNEVLNGAHVLRPGDIGLYMFVSENTYEAKGRIFTVKAILDALGVAYEPLDRDTRVVGTPLCFGVRAGRIGAVSGPVVIGFTCDEEAKWRDEETGANPATEVISSIRPATVTQPHAHEFHFSSPWSTIDAHAEMFAEGDTDEQMVAHAPTWVANPTVTEAETRKLERDEQTWQREYGAVPMGSTEVGFFDHGAIDEAARCDVIAPVKAGQGIVTTAGGDLAFERNSATLAFGHRTGEWTSDATQYLIADMLELRPDAGPLMPGEVISTLAERLKWHGCDLMMADGHYRMAAVEHLRTHKLHFSDAPTGQLGKAETHVRLRVVVHGGRFKIADHPLRPKLVRQMKELTSRPTAGGSISLSSPHKSGGEHGDILSGVVLSVWQRSGKMTAGPPGPAYGTPEWQLAQAALLKQKALDEAHKRAVREGKALRRRYG
jgi:hypothetical protein